jgi:hypothetical protein
MTPIQLNIESECLSVDCKFSHICSQHTTADSIRKLNNFRPELLIDIDNGEILCKSMGSGTSYLTGYYKINIKQNTSINIHENHLRQR